VGSPETLALGSPLPWVVIGDFNEAMWGFEHFSACERSERQMSIFRDALNDCDIVGLGFTGLPFTYDNGRRGAANVRVRLDRAVADTGWHDRFGEATLHHLVSSRSDHCQLLLEIKKESWEHHKPRIFRYEIMWEHLESLAGEIKEAWCTVSSRGGLGGVAAALQRVQRALRTWSKQKFGSVTRDLELLRARLEELRGDMHADRQEIRRVMDRMDELLYREEMMWLQRSRLAWLKEGDKNTSYFHRQAVWRARKNRIKKLKDPQGDWQEDPHVLKLMTTNFFKNLYQADPGVVPVELLNLTEAKITQDMNEHLCKEFTDQEISDALFQMGPLKAPGPDGFPARFFQRHWETLRDDVIPVVRKVFHDGVMPPGINDTALVLIPKGNNPTELKDFRPISLCNVIYKIISKCLVNRLRPILNDIISPEQSAFVPRRLITDNAIIAFECIHAIQRGAGGREEFCAYKLDLSKAYDHVDWGFLKSLLEKLGFQSKWVQWIMTCVSSVRYTVRFNGAPLVPFAPSHGLRQGDPLSPYIFLLVADGLSVLLKHFEQQGRLEGLRVSHRAPSITHLLFADDSLLFFRANAVQAQNVKDALTIFERCTGQLLNPSKCSMLTREGREDDQIQQVRDILRVERIAFEEKYLGLPTPRGRMKRGVFQPLEQRFLK
jgi:hypothetical protein